MHRRQSALQFEADDLPLSEDFPGTRNSLPNCMLGILRFHLVVLIALASVTPVRAQFGGNDLLNLGIQILNGAAQQQPPPNTRQPPSGYEVQKPARAPSKARQESSRETALVFEVQRQLDALGYPVGTIDGRAGGRTRQAILAFQRDHNLPMTGEADAYLLGALRMAGSADPSVAPRRAETSNVASARPSFNCSSARKAAERAICSIPELAALDRTLASSYSAAVASGITTAGAQNRWIARRNRCGDDTGCIAKSYQDRLSQLAGAPGVAAATGSGTKGAGGRPAVGISESGAGATGQPSYADFVHLALMSDTESYLADSAMTGVAYISATGTEQQCRQLYEAARMDEFSRRDYLDQAGVRAREIIASLPARPRRLEVPLEATYALADYDFERRGFPFASYQHADIPIIAGGVVALGKEKRPPFCRSGLGDFSRGSGEPVDFGDLGAEHAAVPGVDFLPMPPDQARDFRASGGGKVLIKAILIVEPRDQGRGPLKGRIASIAAHDPTSGERLSNWDIADVETSASGQGGAVPWTGELLAALIGPTVEPHLDRQAFDRAAGHYFSYHEREIEAGNPPPQSPLPMAQMRGRQPEVIAALSRDRLRAVLREETVALPVKVTAELNAGGFFEDGTGLKFNRLENDIGDAAGQDPLRNVKLSSRDLPLYEQLPFLRPWGQPTRTGFRESVISGQSMRIALELDRIVRHEPVDMDIEQAAERGLVGSNSRRDSVVASWELDISGVRFEKDTVIVSASLQRVSYRWASDDGLVASIDGSDLPSVSGIRRQAEEALPATASADNLSPPPAGARFGAEMADLLQLRFQPDKVDDRVMERMMLTRFVYEAAAGDQTPEWGHFFREFPSYLEPADRAARLGEFRSWSEARAAALPASLTISLPLSDTPSGKVAPFERKGAQPYASACRAVATNVKGAPTERQVASAKLCDLLDAAWQAPDTSLFGPTYSRNLRYDCDEDQYCAGMYNARVAMKLPHNRGEDIVLLDRLPEIDAAVRGMTQKLVLEIEVEPTGASVEKSPPDTIWSRAFASALGFEQANGLGIMGRPDARATEETFVVFTAKALSARIVDRATGAVVAEPRLVAPAMPPADMLVMPKSQMDRMDVLGIRLGMSFAEADQLIRSHMELGKILTADRKQQFGSVSGDIAPYTSGRIYSSAEGNELIAIFDEPPAAPETVLGIWRILRLPRGGAEPASLRTTLAERYGEPRAVKEVSLPFMNKGLAFLWFDHLHERCGVIDFSFQTGLWQAENGDATWLPPFMSRPYYPLLGRPIMVDAADQSLPPSSFCPAFLGVRYATYDGRNAEDPAGDELVTWLSDQRSYAKYYYESRKAPAEAPKPDGQADAKIKF